MGSDGLHPAQCRCVPRDLPIIVSTLVLHMFDYRTGDIISGAERDDDAWALAVLRLHDMGIVQQHPEGICVYHYWRYLSHKRYDYYAGTLVLPED